MILLLISRERRILRENRAREQARVYHERIYTIPYQVRRNNIRWRGRNRRNDNEPAIIFLDQNRRDNKVANRHQRRNRRKKG